MVNLETCSWQLMVLPNAIEAAAALSMDFSVLPMAQGAQCGCLVSRALSMASLAEPQLGCACAFHALPITSSHICVAVVLLLFGGGSRVRDKRLWICLLLLQILVICAAEHGC